MRLRTILVKMPRHRFLRRRRRTIFLLGAMSVVMTMTANVYILNGYVPTTFLFSSGWMYGGLTLVYPVNGTGETLDISRHFDPGVFNSFCETTNPVSAVITVYSDVDNFKVRKTLRDTLGKVAKKLNCKLFFISGVSLKDSVNELAMEEYVKERDMLMVPKLDTFRHLNNKAVAMLEWTSRYCAHAPYVIHLKDDVYINLERFLYRLKQIHNPFFILGKVNSRMPAPRDATLKNHVTIREYPMFWFPEHIAGHAYAFPGRVSARLLSVVHAAMYCWLEDVWLTGHVRQAAGVNLAPLRDTEWTTAANVSGSSGQTLAKYFFVHSVTVDRDLYSKLYSKDLN